MGRMHNPPHPGEVLQDWLADVSVTQAAQQPRPLVQRMTVTA